MPYRPDACRSGSGLRLVIRSGMSVWAVQISFRYLSCCTSHCRLATRR